MVQLNFNANEVDPAVGFEPIPVGEYVGVIDASEMKANKAGTGRYLQLQVSIVEGQYANRKIWVRLNLENPNPTAVGIARAELSAICRAVGVMTPKDSVQLHDKPMRINVGMDRDQNGKMQNKITKYEALSASAGGTTAPPAQPGQQAGNQAPPWQRQAG